MSVMGIEVPDIAEPPVGWKVLNWTGTRFYSGSSFVWPYDGPAHATCRHGGRPPCDTPCGGYGNGCGIYAFADLGEAVKYLRVTKYDPRGRMPMVVRVQLGGRFIPYERGYRAEYAMVDGVLAHGHDLTRWISATQRETMRLYSGLGVTRAFDEWKDVVIPPPDEVREAARCYEVEIIDATPAFPAGPRDDPAYGVMGRLSRETNEAAEAAEAEPERGTRWPFLAAVGWTVGWTTAAGVAGFPAEVTMPVGFVNGWALVTTWNLWRRIR